MKKTLIAILCIVCIVSCVVLSACDQTPKYNETFNGHVSEQTYDTVVEAAQAYLAEEISGRTSDVTFVDYVAETSLSETEIDGLELSAAERARVVSAERGTVYYTETAKGTSALTRAAANTKTKEIYVLNEGSAFRYYVPAMVVGGEITKSYYDYVFDKTKYVNFTASGKQTMDMKIGVNVDGYVSESGVITTDSTFTYKVADNVAYMLSESQGIKTELLLVETQSGLKMFANVSGLGSGYDTRGWMPLDDTLLGLTYSYLDSIDEFVAQINYDQFDQTFFVKTENGFACRKDRFVEMFQIMYEQMFDSDAFDGLLDSSYMQDLMSLVLNSMKEIDINFFVRDGRLADCTGKLVIDMNYTYDTTMSMSIYEASSFQYTYTDFGSTKITIPAAVQAYL